MSSLLYWMLLIVACLKQGILQDSPLTLSSSKEVVLENSSVALTCSSSTGILQNSIWKTSMYVNYLAQCARVDNVCVKTSFLNNTTFFDCICNDNGSYTVLMKHVDRHQHGLNWTCMEIREESNTVMINVSVPVTNAILTSTENKLVHENKSATFTCNSSYSLPSAQIRWYRTYSSYTEEITHSRGVNKQRQTHTRNDNVIRVTEILVYWVNRSVHEWSVYCTATNWQNNVITSNKIELSIVYPPDRPVVDGLSNGEPYKVIENEVANLSCSVKGGNPLAKPEWHCEVVNDFTLNGHVIYNKTVTSYISLSAERTDGKTCTCQTGHVLSNISVHVNINVLYPPETPFIELKDHLLERKNVTSVAKLIEHKSYRLLCSADANPPPSEYIWDGPQKTGISYNASIDLSDVNRTQNGTYTCHSRNIMRPTYGEISTKVNSSNVKLEILFKPTLAAINRQYVAEGSTLNITCKVISANPSDVSFTWTRAIDLNRNSKELFLQNVSRHDAMNYTCSVTNHMRPTVGEEEEGYANETFFLNVWYRASVKRFEVNGHEQDVPKESENITLRCEIDSNPDSTIKIITPNGTEIISTGTNVFEYSHFLSSCVDNGTYTCSGSNEYNYGHPGLARLSVFVKCTPMAHHHIKTDIRSELYVPVILTFRAVAYPEPEFTWEEWANSSWHKITNNSKFSTSSVELQSNLTVTNFTTISAEVYRLIVENEVGRLIQEYTLKPYDRPGTPTEFKNIKELLTVTSATLSWKPGFNGGIPQLFIIMYRDDKYNWKKITVSDTGNTVMNVTVHKLSSDTGYIVQLFAKNSEGTSENVTMQLRTKAAPVDVNDDRSIVGVVAGSVSGVVVVTLGAVIGILVYKKRYKKNTDSSKEERSYVNVTEMTTVSGGKRPVVNVLLYEQLKPGTERDDKRMEQPYDTLEPEQDSNGATSQTYANLIL